MGRIRVLVVEDSLVFQKLLVENLGKNPLIEVVATAENPYEARDAIIAYHPDVMTLDIELPKMDGIEFLQKLMPQYPIPVVVISALSEKVFDALSAGAVDFVAKPYMGNEMSMEDFFRYELPEKIMAAAVAKLTNTRIRVKETSLPTELIKKGIVVIGASTGGTEAVSTVVRDFREDIPGVVVVQHMPAGFTKMYAENLDAASRVTVKEAKSGDMVKPGQVLIAPGGEKHLHLVRMNGEYQVILKDGPRVNNVCPAVDVLFDDVAKVAGANAIGVILTGMGADGASGLLKMRRAGAATIGQDESTCVIYGMPKVAFDNGAVQYQEKLQDISKRIYSILQKKAKGEG